MDFVKQKIILLIILMFDLVLSLFLAEKYPARWLIVIASSSTAFAALSILVYSRRLLFASASSPHAAFLAAGLGILLGYGTGIAPLAWTVIIGLVLVYTLGFMVYRGVDPDDATSLFVSFSTSAGALTVYYVMSKIVSGADISAIIIGDPLLAGPDLVKYSALVALATVILTFLCAPEIVYMGTDPDDAKLSGIRVWLYDLILFTLIGLASVGMVTVVGFVIEHPLLLLPGAVSVLSCRCGSLWTMVASIIIGLSIGVVGLLLAVLLNLSPSGIIGLLLVIVYLAALAFHRSA
ncbi:MAG: metal ABC transporter permease [Desulfurococcales archaeon]|nr:metal ABC transporter permease [Desulfurococcales archaeon]